uniref:DUF4377 domain-containing protein n=1 Tax=Flavobacterium sp. TaxID=239 RepID=UPI0040493FB0
MQKIFVIACFHFVCGFALAQDSKVETLQINPYLKVQNDAFFKILALDCENSYVDYIKGFDFEWGYFYTLKVKITQLEKPPADGSNYVATLLETIQKTKVLAGFQFKMLVTNTLYLSGDPESCFEPINKNTFRYFDKINIEVPDLLMNHFEKILNHEEEAFGMFTFLENGDLQLVSLQKR